MLCTRIPDTTAALGVGDKPWPGIHRGTAIWSSEDEGVTWGEHVYLDGVPGLEPLHPNLQAPLAVRATCWRR